MHLLYFHNSSLLAIPTQDGSGTRGCFLVCKKPFGFQSFITPILKLLGTEGNIFCCFCIFYIFAFILVQFFVAEVINLLFSWRACLMWSWWWLVLGLCGKLIFSQGIWHNLKFWGRSTYLCDILGILGDIPFVFCLIVIDTHLGGVEEILTFYHYSSILTKYIPYIILSIY